MFFTFNVFSNIIFIFNILIYYSFMAIFAKIPGEKIIDFYEIDLAQTSKQYFQIQSGEGWPP